MADMQYYINTGTANQNNIHQTLQEIIASLGGYTNPAKDDFKDIEHIAVTDPTLLTIQQYIDKLGADGYQYKYDDILNNKTAATDAAFDAQYNTVDDAQRDYYRTAAANQQTAADTIRSQYSQAIQQGISKGMQNANMLSTLLGTSQINADEASKIADQRYQTGQDYQSQLLKDAADSLTTSNTAYETLMANIRQLYNDDIQQKTADLEYNASADSTNANYHANRYTADTNYANGINTNASGIYNNNQSSLASIIAAAASAAAQDNYTESYRRAAEAQAAAQAAAARAASASYGGGSTSKTPTSTTQSGNHINNAYGSAMAAPQASARQAYANRSKVKLTAADYAAIEAYNKAHGARAGIINKLTPKL